MKGKGDEEGKRRGEELRGADREHCLPGRETRAILRMPSDSGGKGPGQWFKKEKEKKKKEFPNLSSP